MPDRSETPVPFAMRSHASGRRARALSSDRSDSLHRSASGGSLRRTLCGDPVRDSPRPDELLRVVVCDLDGHRAAAPGALLHHPSLRPRRLRRPGRNGLSAAGNLQGGQQSRAGLLVGLHLAVGGPRRRCSKWYTTRCWYTKSNSHTPSSDHEFQQSALPSCSDKRGTTSIAEEIG